MDESNLEILTRLSLEGADWDRRGASHSRTAACLSMGRLAALAEPGAAMSAGERAHVTGCRLCAARHLAFGGAPIGGGRLRAARLWFGGLSAAAACLLIWSLAGPRPAGPRIPAGMHARVEAPRPVACILGDSNCDGIADSGDITAFALALHQPEEYAVQYPQCDLVCSNDLNGDCEVNDHDLEEMVKCIGG